MSEGSIIEYSEDLSQQEAPKPLPAKDYLATVSKAEKKTSPTSGNEYAAVTFTIDPKEYPADYPLENNPDGVTMMFPVSIEDAPKARWRMKKFCEALDAPYSKHVDLTEFLGKEATVSVIVDTYEGEPQNKIKKVSKA